MFGRKKNQAPRSEEHYEDDGDGRLLSRFRNDDDEDAPGPSPDDPRDDVGKKHPVTRYNDDPKSPHPDHSEKPKSPKDMKKPSWTFALKRTFGEFVDDGCTDLAAALTYYSILSIFPAAVALFSILGVMPGNASQTAVDTIMKVVGSVVTDTGAISNLKSMLNGFANSGGASIGLVIGILGALWSASNYVGAFSRAMNKMYEVGEGRPFWKIRPMQIVVTVLAIALSVVALVLLAVSGKIAKQIGDMIGFGSSAVQVWSIAKWPALLLVVMMIVALLYYATPNVRQPKFRWMSLGAFVAILTWVLASAAFGLYVVNFSSYNKQYGALGMVIVVLLWIWITNLALLFGAELDAELERSRQLQGGIVAEETLQLPLRDAKGVEKREKKQAKAVERGRELRERFTHKGSPEDRPFRKN